MADFGRAAWQGIEVLFEGDQDRVRSSYTAIEVLSPLEERARAGWVGIENLITGDVNRARSSWFAIEALMDAQETIPVEGLALALELHTFENQEARPLTGIFSDITGLTDPTGWIWDRRRLEDSRWNYAQYLTNLGGHSVGLQDGTIKAWWQSGTNLGCEYIDIVHKFISDRQTWTPTVEIGQYSLQWEPHLLYSDWSYTSRFNTANVENGLMKHELYPDAVWTSIQVALWKRDSLFTIRKYWDFQFVTEFSGEIDEINNVRLDTTDVSGNIIVGNLSTRKKEFLIRGNTVLLNGIHSVDNRFLRDLDYPDAPPITLTEPIIEPGGQAQEDGRAVLLTYLPVQPGTIRVWVNDGGLIEWTRVDDLGFAEPNEYVFQVDYDLGIVQLGGFQAPDLILLHEISAFETEIVVYPEQTSIDEYPQSGVIIIGTEEIAYLERTNRRFSNCIRGYNGTTPVGHLANSPISHRRMGLGSTGSVYTEYQAVPRIDYEVSPYGVRTANTSRSWLDVKPLSNVESNNIVQIHPGDISLDRILLETDSPPIGGNLYGPVFYGSDVSRMTATGFDPHDNPVPDVELTIAVIEGGGRLNGVLTEFTDISNTLGQIYADYNHSMIREDFEFEVTNTSHVGGDTVMTVPELIEGTDLNDVWVFQILKFDKIVGTVGLPLEITGIGAASLPYGLQFIDLDGVISQDFRDGVLNVTIASIRHYRTITWLENLLDVNDVLFTRVYIDVPIIGLAATQIAYLLESQAIEWDPELLNGTRYILYEFRNDVLHPLTNELGAYFPLHPDSIDVNTGTITFTDKLLPLPDPDTQSNNLGAYVVVAPGQATLQAYGRDPMTGQLVESNLIRLQLELPSFMTGVRLDQALPIPVGARIPNEEHNIGSGVGGVVFLSLNPAAGTGQLAIQIEI